MWLKLVQYRVRWWGEEITLNEISLHQFSIFRLKNNSMVFIPQPLLWGNCKDIVHHVYFQITLRTSYARRHWAPHNYLSLKPLREVMHCSSCFLGVNCHIDVTSLKKKRKVSVSAEFTQRHSNTPALWHSSPATLQALARPGTLLLQFYIHPFLFAQPTFHISTNFSHYFIVTGLSTRRFFIKHLPFLHSLHFCLSNHIYAFDKWGTCLWMLIIYMPILVFIMLPCIFAVKGFLTTYYYMPQITLSLQVCSYHPLKQ